MAISNADEAARAMEKVNRALEMAHHLSGSVDRARAALRLDRDVRNSGLSTLLEHAMEEAGDVTRFLRAEPCGPVPGA